MMNDFNWNCQTNAALTRTRSTAWH